MECCIFFSFLDILDFQRKTDFSTLFCPDRKELIIFIVFVVPDSYTLRDAELKMGSSLGLCPGKAPTSSQLFLFFSLGSDIQPGSEMEIIVEETVSVRDCLKTVLEKFGLLGDAWHLRRMDWCCEAGEPLREEVGGVSYLLFFKIVVFVGISIQIPTRE